MKRTVRIGTRGSLLALTQARNVARDLKRRHRGVNFQLVVVRTTGDEFQSVELFKKTNVGVFTKALEKKLLRGEIDIAVHSLKDLPTRLPRGLAIGAYPKRLDARDVLISRGRHSLNDLPKNAVVGTGSPRRKRQILRACPDLRVEDIRGNLDTRVRKVVVERKFDAIVVAAAGLKRLRRYARYARPIPAAQLMPAVGQAALAVQVRSGDKETLKMVRPLNHAPTEMEARAERSFLDALGGGCRVPVGILSRPRGRSLHLKAAVFSTKSDAFVEGEARGALKNPETIGEELAKRLLKKGAARFLREARSA